MPTTKAPPGPEGETNAQHRHSEATLRMAAWEKPCTEYRHMDQIRREDQGGAWLPADHSPAVGGGPRGTPRDHRKTRLGHAPRHRSSFPQT